MDTEGEPIPSSLVPRKLVRQVAERMALQLVCNCHSALVKCLFDPQEMVRDSMIAYLKRLKEQYWNDKYGLVEHFRRHISACFTDVMELHASRSEVMRAEDLNILKTSADSIAPEVIVTLAAQILFTYEAGYSGEMDMLYILCIRGVTKRLNKLLESVGTFNLEMLSTAFIKFEETKPLITLIKNSPNLKHVYIVNNGTTSVLNSLRTYSKNIESFYFKLFAYYSVLTRGSSLKDFLFETFFEGLGLDSIMDMVREGGKAPKSFPKLKQVILNNNSQNSVPIKEFMLCLQHYYPDVVTRWTHYVNTHKPRLPLPLTEFQLQAPFLDKEYYKWDVLHIGYVDGVEMLDDSDGRGAFPYVNHVIIEVAATFNQNTRDFIKDLMERHQCRSLELALYSMSSLVSGSEIASAFNVMGSSLQKLCLNLFHDVSIKELAEALNACYLLEVLNLEVHFVEYKQERSPFKEFLMMHSLTLAVYTSGHGPTENFKSHLVAAAPNIETLRLSEISDEGLDKLDTKRLLKLSTFHIGCSPHPKNLVNFIQKLPSLSLLAMSFNYRHQRCSTKSIYYRFRENLKGTALSVQGIGKFSRYHFKQFYEF